MTQETTNVESKEIPFATANEALMQICGGKASDWLSTWLNGLTPTEALRLREIILKDYSYNSFSIVGVDNLSIVLKFISQELNKNSLNG